MTELFSLTSFFLRFLSRICETHIPYNFKTDSKRSMRKLWYFFCCCLEDVNYRDRQLEYHCILIMNYRIVTTIGSPWSKLWSQKYHICCPDGKTVAMTPFSFVRQIMATGMKNGLKSPSLVTIPMDLFTRVVFGKLSNQG